MTRTRSPRPVVVVVAAALCGALVVEYHDDAVLAAYLVLAVALVVLSAIDLERLLLPNRIVYPLVVMVGALLTLAAVVDDDWTAWRRALAAGFVSLASFGLLHLVSPRGLGLGDVKLVAALGPALGWLGWGELVLGMVLAFVIGAVVGLGLVASRRLGRRDHLPFGPFLAAGTLVTLLWGDSIASWYHG